MLIANEKDSFPVGFWLRDPVTAVSQRKMANSHGHRRDYITTVYNHQTSRQRLGEQGVLVYR